MSDAISRTFLTVGLFVLAIMLPQASFGGDKISDDWRNPILTKNEIVTPNEDLARSKTASQSDLTDLWRALAIAQSKIKTLESLSSSSFNPPASLNFSKDKKIDPLVSAYPIAKKAGLRLAQVHFNASSSKVSPSGERLTLEAAEWIKTLPTKKIIVAGFSDTSGPADANKLISQKRAMSVAAVLKRAGIDPNSIEIIAMGEEGAPEKTGDDVAEPLNRCVAIFAVPDEEKI